MEPLTALSVATSIISFVDFGSKLLSRSRKLYQSANGVLTENVHIEVIAADIATLAQGLRRKLPEHRPLAEPSLSSKASGNDDILDDLCRRCVEIATELAVRLDKLKVKTPSRRVQRDNAKLLNRKSEGTAEKHGGYMKPTGWDPEVHASFSPTVEEQAPDDHPAQLDVNAQFFLSKEDGDRHSMAFRSWQSFRKALEASWNKQEIEDLAATLRDFRGEIQFRMLLMFR